MVSYIKISRILLIAIIALIVICEAKDEKKDEKEDKKKLEENKSKNNSTKLNDEIERIDKKMIYKCNEDIECSNFLQDIPELASCNKTSNQCENYCYVQRNCMQDIDCGYGVNENERCSSICYRRNPRKLFGECFIVSKEGKYCNGQSVICEGDLVCDIFSLMCITKNEASSQSGEPVFSLFLFMIIMLSLFNKQRSDEELLNAVSPNELLMITFPNHRQCPEEDPLPLYQPVDSQDDNGDEVLERNIPDSLLNNETNADPQEQDSSLLPTNLSNDHIITLSNVELDDDFDNVPLQPPPSYDESVAISNDNDNVNSQQEQPLLSHDNNNNDNNNNNTQ